MLLWTKCFLVHFQSLIYMGCCTRLPWQGTRQFWSDKSQVLGRGGAGKPKMPGMLPGDFPSTNAHRILGCTIRTQYVVTTRDSSGCNRFWLDRTKTHVGDRFYRTQVNPGGLIYGWRTWWPTLEQCKWHHLMTKCWTKLCHLLAQFANGRWRHLVAKFATISSGAVW